MTSTETNTGHVIGRFAPSPTGPLHFGSLIAAVCSYTHVKHQRGQWRLRIDDLDTPRVVAGCADAILHTLEAHGFEWDGAVVYQGQRSETYQHAAATLTECGHTYPCICSRKDIAAVAQAGLEGPIYPGTCRNGIAPQTEPCATRLRVENTLIETNDLVQGHLSQNLATDIGDFVIMRADAIAAYHLATVVDDIEMGITQVIRGADLMNSTCRQIYIQTLLGAAIPEYGHFPVAVNAQQLKISKQTKAEPLDLNTASDNLIAALAFLGQSPPEELLGHDPAEILAWGIENWNIGQIPKQAKIVISPD